LGEGALRLGGQCTGTDHNHRRLHLFERSELVEALLEGEVDLVERLLTTY
jgi:hypothetical protein